MRKAASTKAESTTAESAIRPKQPVRLKNDVCVLNSNHSFLPREGDVVVMIVWSSDIQSVSIAI